MSSLSKNSDISLKTPDISYTKIEEPYSKSYSKLPSMTRSNLTKKTRTKTRTKTRVKSIKCSYDVSPSGYVTSCNHNFKIHYDKNGINDMPGKIFIKRTIPVNYSFLKISNEKLLPIPKGYVCYEYVTTKFKNDCLQFAEGLTINNPEYRGKDCILREKSTQLLFGESDKQNMKIAKTVELNNIDMNNDINTHVNPEIGESYAYVLKNIKKVGEAPYHIAHVLFKDGYTNITLEANAGDKKAKKPKFDMYDTRINSDATFHDETTRVYKESYKIEKIPLDIEDYVTVLLENATK